ncbi:aminoacyl-tRNA hydrolase [Agathobaculum sp.]|uniref:aminoacyl-tRNA hydrolase n=1 Tax=Agathobaculum sp. TaxID=2048138 RepID=UPI002A7FE274|nr:aminoacyl-tRNA hydrolase [Agathobaculum sp.]MDY3619284.1 aminoacyl-tRNA hydrolase [Agathobaculum sp.]
MSVFDIFKKLDAEKAGNAAQPVEWLVVGLGNPGSKYEGTRHNAGFRALDAYCARTGQRIDKMKFKALAGEGMLGGKRVLFLKPQTFMNLSGEAVRDAAAFYKIEPAHIIVLSDDVSLDVGTLRVRPKGSAGGQNGLKNIIYHLKSEDFPRIKIGVGHKPHPDYDLADWVLSKFTADEREAVDAACRDAVEAAACIISAGCPAAAQQYNGTRLKQQ